jgi:hypothetical protein
MRDELQLKARLLVDGVQVSASALEGVGGPHKEQVHHLFEYDFDVHAADRQPAELQLPGGSVVQVRMNHRAPFRVERSDGALVLLEHGRDPIEVSWLPRPAFYDETVSSGRPMTAIAELVGADCLSVSHTNACLTFSNDKQCAFCNLNYTPRQYDDVVVRKRAEEVGEVAGAAFADGVARHFTITGGILPGDREIGLLETYLEAFREGTGLTQIPGYVIMTPPEDLRSLERLHALGLQGVGFNLECWDEAWFKAVCPGKQERIGYERYREAQRVAVEIFGSGGRVFSGFVAGIEPMPLLLEGVQALAEEGVASIPLVWSPSAGTRLEGHRSPYGEWHLELAEKAAALMIRHLKRDVGAPREAGPRCTLCQTQCLLQDVMESRLRIFRRVSEGLAPEPAEPGAAAARL